MKEHGEPKRVGKTESKKTIIIIMDVEDFKGMERG